MYKVSNKKKAMLIESMITDTPHIPTLFHTAQRGYIPLPHPRASFTAPGFSAETQNGCQLCCLLPDCSQRLAEQDSLS